MKTISIRLETLVANGLIAWMIHFTTQVICNIDVILLDNTYVMSNNTVIGQFTALLQEIIVLLLN